MAVLARRRTRTTRVFSGHCSTSLAAKSTRLSRFPTATRTRVFSCLSDTKTTHRAGIDGWLAKQSAVEHTDLAVSLWSLGGRTLK